MRSTDKIGRMLEFARTRQGLLTTTDLLQLGFDRNAIKVLVDDRVLQRVVRGLYRVRGSRSAEQDIAAVLSRHHGAVTSHRSALFLHRFTDSTPAKPEFTLPLDSTGKTTLGVLYRSPLPPEDVTTARGFPTTTAARSLVDSSRVLELERLGEAINIALARGEVTTEELVATALRLEAHPGRLGHARLRQAMAGWTDAIRPDSAAEAAILRRIVDDGLPLPVTQYEVRDHGGAFVARVDLAWPSERVVREYDSDLWHSPAVAEKDELRRQRLERLGWMVRPLNRTHLRPSSSWPDQLRADLSRASRTAS